MVYKYGIDFGTTNSSIAVRFLGDDDAEHTMVVDVKDTLPRETLPSVILINPDGVFVGENAANRYTQHISASGNQKFIKRIKLDLENKGSELNYEVAGKKYQGVDLIAAILKELRLKAEKTVKDLDIEISGVVMGIPVQYGDIQKNVLKDALVRAGYYKDKKEADCHTEFVSEPIAVAVHYGLNLAQDKTIMVFDFGGGTLDLAIVNLRQQIGNDKLHPHQTIAKERITLGGEELTRLFFINGICKKYGVRRIANEFGFDPKISPEQLWMKLSACEDGVRFIDAIERCKCDLSKASKHRFSFIGNNIQLEEKIFFREEFNEAISDKLTEIDELVQKCLDDGNIDDPYDIDQVILAGGSSLIPAVQQLLVDIFGVTRVSAKLDDKDAVIKSLKRNRAVESEVLTSIVRGLAAIGCREKELIEDVVDNDYGVWDTLNNDFIPIIENGIPVKNTALDKLSGQGIYQEVKCVDEDVSSVEVLVYQRNLNGAQKLGTINIPNPGSKLYRIYMSIDPKTGSLVVTIFDSMQRRWFDEIPLDERTYTLK